MHTFSKSVHLPIRADLTLPGMSPQCPCGPILAHSWIGEDTQSTGCFHKWNMNLPQDPSHNEVPSFLRGPLRSRTKHFTSVSPSSSHSSDAAWIWNEEHLVARESTVVNANCLTNPGYPRQLLLTFPSGLRKWSSLLNRYTSLCMWKQGWWGPPAMKAQLNPGCMGCDPRRFA